jgi:hypothetical protein
MRRPETFCVLPEKVRGTVEGVRNANDLNHDSIDGDKHSELKELVDGTAFKF